MPYLVTPLSVSREETTETVQRASASSATAKMVQRMRAEQNQQRMEVMQRASSQQRTSRREEKQSAASIKAGEIKVSPELLSSVFTSRAAAWS